MRHEGYSEVKTCLSTLACLYSSDYQVVKALLQAEPWMEVDR